MANNACAWASDWGKALGMQGARASMLLESAQKTPTPETIHKLSTTLRRILVLDRVVREFWNTSPLSKTGRKSIKTFRQPLGHMRDLEEVGVKFRDLQLRTSYANAFSAFLLREKKNALHRLLVAIRDFDKQVLLDLQKKKRMRKLFSGKACCTPQEVVSGNLLRLQNLRATAIEEGVDAELHCFRVQYKRYRYSMEVLRPYLPKGLACSSKALKPLQDSLGDAHDWMVLESWALDYAQDHWANGCAEACLCLHQRSHIAHQVARACTAAWLDLHPLRA